MKGVCDVLTIFIEIRDIPDYGFLLIMGFLDLILWDYDGAKQTWDLDSAFPKIYSNSRLLENGIIGALGFTGLG